MPKASTQYAQSQALRERLKKLFPELVSAKDDLGKLLDEAQNAPPHGGSDGSITPVQYNQLRGIHDTLNRFLVAQLFDTRGAATARVKAPVLCWGCRSRRPGASGLCMQCRATCTCTWDDVTLVDGDTNRQTRVRIDSQCPFHEGA